MDLKAYYQKIREIERSLKDEHPVIVSRETPDGGREGARAEVPRGVAAKMIVEGRARLASVEEKEEFLAQKAEAKRQADLAAAAARMQVTVVSEGDLRALKGAVKAPKP